jgi:hypothetical protein
MTHDDKLIEAVAENIREVSDRDCPPSCGKQSPCEYCKLADVQAEAALRAVREWQPIESAPRDTPKGYVRIYSFAPSNNGRCTLSRLYDTERCRGHRVCDYYIDLPQPPQEGK